MNTQRIITIFLVIGGIGSIFSTFSMIISSGIVSEAYPLCQIIFYIFVLFYFLGIIPYFREQNKDTHLSLNEVV